MKDKESLRQRVLNWCSDHPYTKDIGDKNAYYILGEQAFRCHLEKTSDYFEEKNKKIYKKRTLIRKYIDQYFDQLEDIFWDKKYIQDPHLTRQKRNEDGSLEEDIKNVLPMGDPGFFMFCRWFAIPNYAGLFEWQREHHELTWLSKYEMTLVPRDHGKTVAYVQKYQWAMQYMEMDILLLGWTDRRKEAALYVYSFFFQNDLIEKDKRTSPFHFRIKNGGKFDCYLITSKETLGMHTEGEQNRFSDFSDKDWQEIKSLYNFDENETITEKELKAYIKQYEKKNRKLWIAIDDPIDISFMKERHKEDTLELHHDSSLYPIHPFKWSYTGTHKFEGDFFDFIKNKFEDEIVVYQRSTLKENGQPLCPEKFTHPDLPTYKEDLKKGKLCLATIRKHVGEYSWWAEYEQDPHPITGDIWDHVGMTDFIKQPIHLNYDLCWVSIDRATTTKVGSSFTGCLVGLRDLDTGHLIVQFDWTGRIQLEELLIRINNYITHFHNQYTGMPIFIIIETQGGGHDFVAMARDRKDFLHQGERIPNMIAKVCTIIDFHNIGEKIQRIRDRLYLPIKNYQIKLHSPLEHSELVNEILKFPYFPKLDAIDALANAYFELIAVDIQLPKDPMEALAIAYKLYEDKRTGKNVKTTQEKEDEVRRKIKGKKQTIIDSW